MIVEGYFYTTRPKQCTVPSSAIFIGEAGVQDGRRMVFE